MLGFKSFRCAAQVIAGVERMHMIRKSQFAINGTVMSFANQFYALAGQIRPAQTAAMFSTVNSVSRSTTRQNHRSPSLPELIWHNAAPRHFENMNVLNVVNTKRDAFERPRLAANGLGVD